MKHVLDFSDAELASGVHTSYYAGILRVDGVEVVLDGVTDRSSWGIHQLAARQCLVNEGLSVPDDALCPEDYPDDAWDQLEDLCMDAESNYFGVVATAIKTIPAILEVEVPGLGPRGGEGPDVI